MAGGTFIQADVLCPFYISDSDKPFYLKCEGVCDNSILTLGFRYKTGKRRYVEKYCIKGYEDCGLFKAIFEKYNEYMKA
ncbi:hypothetical protein IMSAG049_01249 [Clostridiales bacterium]|nr:hypothetical protein IMSAG049_01249 [Clostridiales bacterium]